VDLYDNEAALILLLRDLSENEEDELADMADRYAASSEEELAVEEERHEIQAQSVVCDPPVSLCVCVCVCMYVCVLSSSCLSS
jgi:UTP-glucose-1-phosphate uridylyltransferase